MPLARRAEPFTHPEWLFLFFPGGPVVTVGVALLFLWMALIGERPAGWSSEGDPPKEIGIGERMLWAIGGAGLLVYEGWKYYSWVHTLRH